MGVINNPLLYPITEMLEGATVIGSMPDDHPTFAGFTVQFSIGGIVDYITRGLDFVNYDKADHAGQNIMGNDADFPETINANINSGNKYFATIKNYPPNSDTDVKFIVRLRE